MQVDNPGVYLENGNRLLRIYRVQPEHAGQFVCTAQNLAGETQRQYNIVVQGELIINLLSHGYLRGRYKAARKTSLGICDKIHIQHSFLMQTSH